MADGAIRWWQTLTTVDVGAIALSDPVVVLPVAAIEQHGRHLPLSTDLEIGLGLLSDAFRRLPDDFSAWALPPQAIGCSREHARFPGTLSLEPDELAALIEGTGEALAHVGVRRIVLSNSHGGNRERSELLKDLMPQARLLECLVRSFNFSQFIDVCPGNEGL